MNTVAPAGPMYQAGTLSGNPLAMTAGLATLRSLLAPGIFETIAARTSDLLEGITSSAAAAGVPIQASHRGTMFGFYFLKQTGVVITDYDSAKKYADTERYGRFFHAMLDQGFYFAPSQFEAGFMSIAHEKADVEATVQAAQNVLNRI